MRPPYTKGPAPLLFASLRSAALRRQTGLVPRFGFGLLSQDSRQPDWGHAKSVYFSEGMLCPRNIFDLFAQVQCLEFLQTSGPITEPCVANIPVTKCLSKSRSRGTWARYAQKAMGLNPMICELDSMQQTCTQRHTIQACVGGWHARVVLVDRGVWANLCVE